MLTAERLRVGLHAVVCGCASFALFAVGFAALQCRDAAIAASSDVDAVAQHLTKQIDLFAETQVQARHLLLDARVSLDNVNKAAIAERLYLTTALPATMGRVDGVLVESTRTVHGLQRVESAATGAMDAATVQIQTAGVLQARGTALLDASALLVQNADAVVSDPNLRKAEANAARAAASSAAAAQDMRDEVHGFTHPTWPRRLWHALRRVL